MTHKLDLFWIMWGAMLVIMVGFVRIRGLE